MSRSLSSAVGVLALICGLVAAACWSLAQDKPKSKEVAEKSPPAATAALSIDEAEAAIWKKLAEPTEFEFKDAKLDQVAAFLAKKHQLHIRVDIAQLSDLAVITNLETPITRSIRGVSLQTALNRLLGDLKLAWVVRHETLFITSREDADTYLVTKVYPVADLVMPEPLGGPDVNLAPDYESLTSLIKNTIRPESWMDAGGPGTIQPLRLTIIVSQSQNVHGQVAALLAALRQGRKVAGTAGLPSEPVIKCHDKSVADRVAKAVGRRTIYSFDETPLADVVKQIAKNHELEIEFDPHGLSDAQIDIRSSPTVTFAANNISLRSALELMLRELKLTWIVADDRMLITSREVADTRLVTHVYPVGDLAPAISPRPVIDDRGPIVPPMPTQMPSFPSPVLVEDYEWLMTVIKNTVKPESWKDAGGPGTLEYSEVASSLVCAQTREVHERIEKVLTDLRTHGKAPPKTATVPAKAAPDLKDDEVAIRSYIIGTSGDARAKVAQESAKLVRELIAPASWDAKDSQYFVRAWPDRLVVRHNGKTLREIEKLLLDLDVIGPGTATPAPAAPPPD